MTDYEKVMLYLHDRCNEIESQWNGDEPGKPSSRTAWTTGRS